MATLISGSTGVDKIQDGTIVNADIASNASIAGSKINGSFGKVLQVVSTTSTSNFVTSSTSYVDTGFTASITPSATSSKVLVLFSSVGGGTRDGSENDNQFGLTRDNGSNYLTVKRVEDYDYGGDGSVLRMPFNINYLDSPSSTNAVAYKIYAKSNNSTAAFMGSNSSSITEFILMEIAG